jgi:crotonobetainyl-CoA:carnitine CoA-transferase CaiB-like acyl-CoA transferase
MIKGPLDGIRILDLSSVIVGPVSTQRLADYGATIIKVEQREGDMLRALGGPSPSGKHAGAFLHFNRNKSSICLDFKKPEARATVMRLLETCHGFVSNMRPEALKRLGMDAASLRPSRPDLVHCTITGFGPDGPYRGRPAFDTVVQGAAGLAGLGIRMGGKPKYIPLFLCDHVVGEISAGAILAALVGQARTGEGAAIEIPMLETMAAFVLQEHLNLDSFIPSQGLSGDPRLLNPSGGPVPTSDGWICISATTDAQAHAFLRAAGRADLCDDPRFKTIADRVKYGREWYAVREELLLGKTTAEWVDILAKDDVPAMPCNTLEALPDDPHLVAVELIQTVEHPVEGQIRHIRPSVLRDGVRAEPGEPAQPLGWDTRPVLTGAGFTDAEIEALLTCGAAVDGHFEVPRQSL